MDTKLAILIKCYLIDHHTIFQCLTSDLYVDFLSEIHGVNKNRLLIIDYL